MSRKAPKKSFLDEKQAAEENEIPRKNPPGFVPWSNPNELQATDRITRTTQQPSEEKKRSTFEEEGQLKGASDGHVPGSNPDARLLSNEARHAVHGFYEVEEEKNMKGPSPKVTPNEPQATDRITRTTQGPGVSGRSSAGHPDTSLGAEALSRRGRHPPAFIEQTPPGAVAVSGFDSKQEHNDDGFTIWDGNDEEATITSHEESTVHVVAEAVDTEAETRMLREQDQIRHERDQIRHERDQLLQILTLNNAPITASPVATDGDEENANHDDLPRRDNPNCGPRGRRLFATSAILLIVIVVVITVTLVVVLPSEPTSSDGTTAEPPTHYCGTTWDDAAINCESAVQCPSGLDDECDALKCYAGISCGASAPTTLSPPPSTPSPTPSDGTTTPPTAEPPTNYCGTTWEDAAINCESAVQCPSGLDYECDQLKCYAGISCGASAPTTPSPPPSTPSPTPPP
jgi:hypothetical protein